MQPFSIPPPPHSESRSSSPPAAMPGANAAVMAGPETYTDGTGNTLVIDRVQLVFRELELENETHQGASAAPPRPITTSVSPIARWRSIRRRRRRSARPFVTPSSWESRR